MSLGIWTTSVSLRSKRAWGSVFSELLWPRRKSLADIQVALAFWAFPLPPGDKFTIPRLCFPAPFIFIFKNFFGCAGSLMLSRAFSSCSKWGLLSSFSAQASHCGFFSCCGAWARGLRASVVVAHRLICPGVCGIFPDQGSNPRPLHWQVDS